MEAFEKIQEKKINEWLANAFSKGTRECGDFSMEEKRNQHVVVA
jgi:hypothetical protein